MFTRPRFILILSIIGVFVLQSVTFAAQRNFSSGGGINFRLILVLLPATLVMSESKALKTIGGVYIGIWVFLIVGEFSGSFERGIAFYKQLLPKIGPLASFFKAAWRVVFETTVSIILIPIFCLFISGFATTGNTSSNNYGASQTGRSSQVRLEAPTVDKGDSPSSGVKGYWDSNGGITDVALDREQGTLKVGNENFSVNKWTDRITDSSGKDVGEINHRGEIDFEDGRNLHS
jgi:hypothetical protein